MNEERRVVIIVQARMQSTRLPGKVMLKVLGRPLLSFLIERLRTVRNADEIVVATTREIEDEEIVHFCRKEKVSFYRGDEHDVLDRYLQAAKAYEADVVVRVTADCPLIDPMVVEKVIQHFFEHTCDYAGNTLELTYPRGMDTEVFSMEALKKTAAKAEKPEEREHVTLYMYSHPKSFALVNIPYKENCSKFRLTVDTPEDFHLIKTVLETLYPDNAAFSLEDVIKLLEKSPELAQINSHIPQKTVEENKS